MLESDCLVATQNENNHNLLAIEEIIAVENALKYKAHYVYFRRFKDRPSVPQVYIYDFTENTVSEDNLIDLHQKLYSSGHVPMFFVFTRNEIKIFNSYDRPAAGKKLAYRPLEVIRLASDTLFELNNDKNQKLFEAFSGKLLDNGSFWEDSLYQDRFQFANSAYEKLLGELKQALNDIINQNVLPASIARKVTVVSILIKYLEERTDEHNNSVFPKENEERVLLINRKRVKKKFDKNFFDQFAEGATCFIDILKKKGAIVDLFEYLSTHFHGDIFEFSETEKSLLRKTSLSKFAQFLEGKLEGVQFVFWRLYSFNDLPVELISNIYEEFLEKRPGVVYTPPYLVNFLLDEAMPYSDLNTNFKILDPACGSGVFLVGAYRRLIYRWRKNNNWKKPSLVVLKKLLKDNIFGSDKDPEAVNLSVFSLCLALCDELTPLQIWENLEFDNLHEENLLNDDFFKLVNDGKLQSNTFDLVIGNPPFESKLTDAAQVVESRKATQRIDQTSIDEKNKQVVKLPDNQIALLFLEQSIELCKAGRLVCLVQPSGPLLYNNTSYQFRKYLLSKYKSPQIIDFTHISRVLFGKNGDVPTAAIFVRNSPSDNAGLLHITVRRTKPNKEKIFFEIDANDFHYVPKKIAVNDPYIWKANFLGGGRFHLLINRLSRLDTLKDYLKSKKETHSWEFGEGFIQGKIDEIRNLEALIKQKDQLSRKDAKVLSQLEKKYKKAAHITNKPSINAKSFYEEDLYDNSHIIKEKYFRFISKESIFTPPHILIKEEVRDNAIPVIFSNNYLTFTHRVIGIHAPKEDKADLYKLYEYLNSKTSLFYIAGTSSEFMVNRSSSILKKDIDSLPYTENKDDLKLSEFEKVLIDDFWNFLLEFRRSGETSKIAVQNAKQKDLDSYGKVFCSVLNSVYKDLKPHAPFQSTSFICYPFYFKDKPTISFESSDITENSINKLLKNISGNTRLTRIIRMYDNNVIYILKPKKLRYWLKSVALRDADETFTDLRKQGY